VLEEGERRARNGGFSTETAGVMTTASLVLLELATRPHFCAIALNAAAKDKKKGAQGGATLGERLVRVAQGLAAAGDPMAAPLHAPLLGVLTNASRHLHLRSLASARAMLSLHASLHAHEPSVAADASHLLHELIAHNPRANAAVAYAICESPDPIAFTPAPLPGPSDDVVARASQEEKQALALLSLAPPSAPRSVGPDVPEALALALVHVLEDHCAAQGVATSDEAIAFIRSHPALVTGAVPPARPMEQRSLKSLGPATESWLRRLALATTFLAPGLPPLVDAADARVFAQERHGGRDGREVGGAGAAAEEGEAVEEAGTEAEKRALEKTARPPLAPPEPPTALVRAAS